jgi:tRNA (cmo5U34)-methyltransferase
MNSTNGPAHAEGHDGNAEIWKSDSMVAEWTARTDARERRRHDERQLLAMLLPFGPDDAFTFADLGAGTGAGSRAILARFPRSTAILADFSPQMMAAGNSALAEFAGRFSYVEFDLAAGDWPATMPAELDAVVTSMSVHHLSDDRKQRLFADIFGHLRPGGWYFNYDPVQPPDELVGAVWERVNDEEDPDEAHRREHPTDDERHRRETHVRYMLPLDPQVDLLRAAGFVAVDVYWKRLENVIYGGSRPS